MKNSLPLPPFQEEADVVKLVDTLDLGSSAARHGGSSPSIRTTNAPHLRGILAILKHLYKL